MSKKIILFFLTALLCAVFTGCAVSYSNENDAFKLYGLSDLSESGGQDAVTYVTIPWKNIPSDNEEEQIAFIVGQIIGDCQDKDYISPVPKATVLRNVTLKAGVANVDFSGNYGNLSGIDLTLADYCITFSLAQLPSVNRVHITVNGKELEYRDSKIIFPRNALLTSSEDTVRTFQATIYYLDENDQLVSEEKVLEFYEGENRADKVVEAMMEKPEHSEYHCILSEEFSVLTIRIEDGTCHFNMAGSNAALYDGKEEQANVILGIRQSVLSLDGVEQVIFYLDGERTDHFGLAQIPSE